MTFDILLVEDNPGDVRLAEEAFGEINPSVRVWSACDGVEAMAFLGREREYRHAPRPDLILLDLNLPIMDGRKVLTLIKEDDSLKTIPIVILTTSEAPYDVINCYRLKANCIVKKPLQLEDFVDLVRVIDNFWLRTARLPQRAASMKR